MKKSMHPYVNLAQCKSESDFYKKFPTPESFFSQHDPNKMPPMHKGHMEKGGVILQQPQQQSYFPFNDHMYTPGAGPDTMPPIHPGHMQMGGLLPVMMPGMNPVNSPVLMNQEAVRTMQMAMGGHSRYSEDGGYTNELQDGGFSDRPGYHFDGNKMVKSKGSGTYNAGVYYQDGGMIDDEMKTGGIHIKKSHEGRFTTYKQRTGKTTEEALHSKDPHVRKMANFAKNAKSWNHEYGGAVNPFNSAHKYIMQGGGFHPSQEEGDPNYNPGIKPTDNSQINYGETSAVPQLNPTASWREGMTDDQAQANIQSGQRTSPAPNQGMRNAAYIGKQTGNLLGAGLAATSYFNNMKNNRDAANYQRELGLSSNLPVYANQFGHGQNGPNNGFSQSPAMNQMQEGGYAKGMTVDLSEEEIAAALRAGYKLQKV